MAETIFIDAVNRVNRFAIEEGWSLFFTSEGTLDLERDDDAARFVSDDDARRHVERLAYAGSSLHSFALQLLS